MYCASEYCARSKIRNILKLFGEIFFSGFPVITKKKNHQPNEAIDEKKTFCTAPASGGTMIVEVTSESH